MTLAEREDATRRVQGEGEAVGATQRLRTRTHDDDSNDNESAEVGLVGEWAGEVTAPPTPPSPGEGDSNGTLHLYSSCVTPLEAIYWALF